MLLLPNLSYNVMNRIHLDCRNEYFDIIGVEIGPFPNIHRWLNTDPRTFPRFPNVRHLEVFFSSAKDASRANLWWHEPTTRDPEGIPCHKVLVEWILCFGKHHIQHIPHISFLGDIKYSTRTIWERILADELKGVHYEVDLDALKALQPSDL